MRLGGLRLGDGAQGLTFRASGLQALGCTA